MVFHRILPSVKRRKSCEGKQSYDTRAAAKAGIQALTRAERNGYQGTLKAYRCEFCDKYHFGHEPQIMPR
jgi:hypothetical protein